MSHEKKELTIDEEKKLQSIALSLWQELGPDAMNLLAEENEAAMTRDHVIELVLDAGRFESEVERRAPELLSWVESTDYSELIRAIKPAFLHETYA